MPDREGTVPVRVRSEESSPTGPDRTNRRPARRPEGRVTRLPVSALRRGLAPNLPGMTFLELVLIGLVTYRVTLLAVADEILDGPREKLLDRLEAWDRLVVLAGCVWCVSVWAGIGTAAAVHAWSGNPFFDAVTFGLAGSAVAGFLSSHASP